MSGKPNRILVYAPLGVGGVTNLMITIQKNIDREALNFDYLVVHDRKEPKEDEVIALGARKLVASSDNIKFRLLRGVVRFFKLRKVVKENHVKILHLNSGAPMNVTTAIAAKLGGVKYVTFHSHNGGMSNLGSLAKPMSFVCKPFMPLFIDSFWACSTEAAKFSFPKSIIEKRQYRFVPNGIDLEKFRFDTSIRDDVRREFGIPDRFVVGHAGRFSFQKNHTFLIDVFYKLKQVRPDAYLLLFGIGEELVAVKEKVERLGLNDSVQFCGTSDEMHKMYQAMDVFLMPSLFEGLPVTVIEAQASNLPCVLSDTITKDCAISGAIKFVKLDADINEWVDAIQAFSDKERDSNEVIQKLREAGFDQNKMIGDFYDFYIDICKKILSQNKSKH